MHICSTPKIEVSLAPDKISAEPIHAPPFGFGGGPHLPDLSTGGFASLNPTISPPEATP